MKPEEPAAPTEALPAPAAPRVRWCRRALHAVFSLLPWPLLAAALLIYVPTNRGLLEYLCVYPPPLLFLVLALTAAVYCVRKRFYVRLVCCLATAGLLIASVGWGGSEPPPAPEGAFVLLAQNVGHDPDNAAPVAAFCRTQRVDFILLQEIRSYQQPPFLDALPEYEFYRITARRDPAYLGQDSSLTGIRKDLLDDPKGVRVEADITGYRTFAVRATVRKQPLVLVNVHTGRADLAPFPLRVLRQWAKHQREGALLAEWLPGQDELPVIAAGDCNAPRQSSNLRLPGMTLAYDVAGGGPHLTFPTWFPLVGIDHALGNRHIVFHSYSTFALGSSDHKAQLVRFSVRR